MNEVIGDIWDFHAQGWVVIPINCDVKSVLGKDYLVMGAGLAKQAAERFPQAAFFLADQIQRHGPTMVALYPERIVAFPTKYHWREDASLELIEQSAQELAQWAGTHPVYLPRVGCGEKTGRLRWADVKPVLERHLDDRFCVISLPDEAEKETAE